MKRLIITLALISLFTALSLSAQESDNIETKKVEMEFTLFPNGEVSLDGIIELDIKDAALKKDGNAIVCMMLLNRNYDVLNILNIAISEDGVELQPYDEQTADSTTYYSVVSQGIIYWKIVNPGIHTYNFHFLLEKFITVATDFAYFETPGFWDYSSSKVLCSEKIRIKIKMESHALNYFNTRIYAYENPIESSVAADGSVTYVISDGADYGFSSIRIDRELFTCAVDRSALRFCDYLRNSFN